MAVTQIRLDTQALDGTLTNAKIKNNEITNDKINASAAIAESKLSLDYSTSSLNTAIGTKLTKTLADGKIFIGDGSNEAVAQTVSGDVTISNVGVVAISSGVIVNADINASAAIAYSKLNIADGDLTIAKTNGLQTALDDKIDDTEKGANNGVATLDSGGKIPVAQLPASVMEFKGAWDADTNDPTLADGTGNAGDFYRVSVAGTQDLGSGSITFVVGDYVMYNGTIWQKGHSGGDAVNSVNGQTGVVVLDTDDVSEGSTNKYYSSTLFNSDFSSADLADLGTKSHTDLDDIGTNTHAQIDSHIASTSNPHSVTKAQVLTGNLIVNADVDAGAAIAESKLSLDYSTSSLNTAIGTKLTKTLADGKIFIGDGSNEAVAQTVSGDVTISNVGVVAISSGVIVNADINASAAIAFSKLAALTSGNILVGSAGNVATSVTMSGDATISNTGAVSIAMSTVVSGHFVTREVPSGDIDGLNAEFTLNAAPIAGTEHVYLNGILQNVGAGNDYTISGDTITFNSAPLTGDVLLVSSIK